jgi:peptidoglycan/LPS O-acetylase OafA/YrhL
MPEPIKRGQRYMPGLDGLRAIAVLAVIAYHLGYGWAPGGLLGVGVFFTLSGYLITDLLLAQVAGGGIRLKAFWFARARRLFPALFVVLIVVMAWVTVIGPHQPPDFRQAELSAAFYANNWWLIFHDVSYFAQFSTPGPLNHLWSLSVEEQFYIVWPFLLLIVTGLVREVSKQPRVRPRLGGVMFVLGLVSAIAMLLIYSPGIDPSRVYYGTDTRAQELLVGAALATIWPSRQLTKRITLGARNTIDALGLAGLVGVFVMFATSSEFSPFLYRGGFFLLSIFTALLVAALAHPAARLGRVLGAQPLRWIGERSYGIYLWHFPIIVLTSADGPRTPDLTRDVLQIAATFIVAALSWTYIENPIRHGALPRIRDRIRNGSIQFKRTTRPGWAILGTTSVVLVMALAGFAGAGQGPPRDKEPGNIEVATTSTTKVDKSNPNRTTCNSVVHIGDSTSEGLVSADYLPNPQQQIAAQYGKVGATTQHLEVSGARSIYETFEGQPNAFDVANSWKTMGFNGCWVFALGTNEAANVSAGSAVGYDERIDSMMSVAGKDPVMWVNVRSIVTSGPYAEVNMANWDKALVRACDRYPHMRIYDWASDVKDIWFIDDGIHFTTPGYAARGRLIAHALLKAFPDEGGTIENTTSKDCLVHPDQFLPNHGKKKPRNPKTDVLPQGTG